MTFTTIKARLRYLARDADGGWHFYANRPRIAGLSDYWSTPDGFSNGCPFNVPFSGNWKDSLHVRDRDNLEEWKPKKPSRKDAA